MKTTKAFFLILLGSFLLATGFAFAENVALGQLQKGFHDDRSASVTPTLGINKSAASLKATAPPAPAPAPAKPGVWETAKKFLTDNARNIMIGGIGAYLGFALLGPVGIILGALTFLWLGTL